ncbi:multicopper oxidase domain-containing protein [Herpetosiphon sp.]|uniref:Copper-containing nitrite reductase n=1 Tax=Herpetosiphon aurantiacus (strain ATCC 23779 / DSM 785 / 114-95) TaxID=316274 RepID=A9B1Q8_HERA2|nr:multicopper oxidase domain-containing protein [Herpetosiphon sp.]ABX03943.1 Nitrite reductase (NO-forming) [Herpetosiphon aurantiacus DSM 785]
MNRRSFIMVVIFSLLLASIAACSDQATRTSSLAPTASAKPESQVVSQQASQPTSQEVLEIHSFDMGFKPQNLTVPSPGVYTIKLVNDGVIPHDITFPDGTVISAKANETVTGEVTIPAEGMNFICAVPGHEAAGMKGSIQVASADAAAVTPTMMDDHSGPAPESDIAADESAPEYILHDAKAPAALEGTLHDIELVVEEKPMTVAPGYVQHVWTFGGTVPGPVIRVKVGDTVRIHLKNPSSNKVPHSIDFHSSEVAWNDEMTSINVGEDKMYEWKANYAGVWMYHCGTTPALHHIANGMYGMVIVEPKEGLPAVDHEFALVQSEWYLGPQGDLVSLEKAASAAPAPEYVVFNGVANQYKDHPLEVKTGASVRVFVLNAGPSIDSSFHVVGTIFNTVIKEGVQLRPETANGYGSQAVDLAPAQGAIVEFTTAEDGLYPIVTHAFNFVGRGALGLFQAGDGDPKN